MKKINSQEDLNQLINLIDWPHAFLRECYLLSPSYVSPEDRGLVAPDIVPTIKALICTQEIEHPGIEMLFINAEAICLSLNCELNPAGQYNCHFTEFSFVKDDIFTIRCKEIFYKILDEDCWGWKTRFGIDNFYDESGVLENQLLGL